MVDCTDFMAYTLLMLFKTFLGFLSLIKSFCDVCSFFISLCCKSPFLVLCRTIQAEHRIIPKMQLHGRVKLCIFKLGLK